MHYKVFWNHKDYHWMTFLTHTHTHSYLVASEDSKYSSWVIYTTFMVLFCPFWSSTDFDGIYFVLWRRAVCTFCWTSCILCSVKERIQVWDDIKTLHDDRNVIFWWSMPLGCLCHSNHLWQSDLMLFCLGVSVCVVRSVLCHRDELHSLK